MFSPMPRISLTQKCVSVPALLLQFSACNVYSKLFCQSYIALMMCDILNCFAMSVSLSIWSHKTQCEGRRLPTGIAFSFSVPLFKYRDLTNISECLFSCGNMKYIIGFQAHSQYSEKRLLSSSCTSVCLLACLPACPSVRPHGTSQLPPDRNLIYQYFSKVC